MHQNGRSLFFGQRRDRLANLPRRSLLYQTLLDGVCVVRRLETFTRRRRRVQTDVLVVMAFIAKVIERDVGCYAEQPGCEFRRWLISMSRPVYAHEDVLGQFLGYSVILHHARKVLNYEITMLLKQYGETRGIVKLHPQHETRVKIERSPGCHTCKDESATRPFRAAR